eukprot:TRINITY_DN271_c0_g1_i5.p1 TRINITY_DN271_c0_g1~~TRINITY_DN271_c0_g1_i5.p1  ORF type:complete len:543 (-),score=115.16 TRINITY_DN271_c0_g1_i5:387-1988(-)
MWADEWHQQRQEWETDEDDTESSSSDDDSDEKEVECLKTALEAQLRRLLQLPWLAQRQTSPLTAEVLEGAHEQLHVVAAEIHGLRTAAHAIPDIRGVTALRAAADMLEDRLEHATRLCAEDQQLQQQDEREGSQAQQRHARTLANSSAAAVTVFNNKQLVEQVLGFVGPGYWLYVAGVSRLLRGRYMAVVAHDWSDGLVPPLFKTSIRDAAVQSPSTLRMAALSRHTGKLLQSHVARGAVGRAASLEILVVAATHTRMKFDKTVLLGAARTADVAFLNEVLSRCEECNDFVGRVWALFGAYAVENVNWRAVFPWLVQQAKCKSWPEWYTTALCHQAVRLGHLEVLQWLLLSGGTQLSGPIMPEFQYCNSLQNHRLREVANVCFPHYHDDLMPQELSLLDSAAFAGKLDIVKWLSAQGGQHPFSARTAVLAAKGGHLKVLQWLRSALLCPFEAQAVIAAMSEMALRPLPIFKWLHEVGDLQLDRLSAAGKTQLLVTVAKHAGPIEWLAEVVQWLMQNGAEWPQSPSTLVAAVMP